MTNRRLNHVSIACLAIFASALIAAASFGDSGQILRLSDASLERIAGRNDMEKTIPYTSACANSLLIPGGGVVADCSAANVANGTACLICTGPLPFTTSIVSGSTGGPGVFAITGNFFDCNGLRKKTGACSNGVCNSGPNYTCQGSTFQQYTDQ